MDQLSRFPRRRVALSAAWVAATSLIGGAAQGFELNWDAPPECPDVQTVERALAKLLGPEHPDPPPTSVVIRRASSDWRATLTFDGATRTVDGQDCASVSEAVVVIVAMAIDPRAASEHGQPEAGSNRASTPEDVAAPRALQASVPESPPPPSPAPPTPVPTPVPTRVTPEPSQEIPAPSPPDVLGWGASVRALAEWGMLPTGAEGGAVALWAGSRESVAEVVVLGLLPQDEPLAGAPDRGGKFYWWAVQLDGCLTITHPLFGCVGFEAGQIAGTGFGIRRPASGSGPWLGPGTTLSLRLPLLPSLQLEASAGAFAALLRPSFELDGAPLHRPSRVSARLNLGIGWGP